MRGIPIPLIILFFSLSLSSGLAGAILEKRSRLKPAVTPLLKHKQIEIRNCQEEATNRILETMSNKYFDPEFSIKQVSEETGISQRKIAAYLINRYAHSFRQLLNKIRLEEAKRLLTETDRQVTEIALLVGFIPQ